MTCEASPPAIFGCACRIPSRTQIAPNPIRSSHRPRGSCAPSRRPPSLRVPILAAPVLAAPVLAAPVLAAPVLAAPVLAAAVPPAFPPPSAPAITAVPAASPVPATFTVGAVSRQVRAVAQTSQQNATMRRAIPPWCSSADLNAATSVGSAGLRPEFMPGTQSAPLSARVGRDGLASGQALGGFRVVRRPAAAYRQP